MEKSLLEWAVFYSIIIILLVLDLGFFHRKNSVITFQKSLVLSFFYFIIACLFSVFIYYHMGAQSTKEYFTGFLIEKAMALDNIFIISIIFRFFAIPIAYQHRVLFWGILGVIVFRAIMIGFSSILIAEFASILYVFAVLLIFTGIKILYFGDKKINIAELKIYKFLQRNLNITSDLDKEKFFVKKEGKWYATNLFVALLMIEAIDIVFAIDSIPAIFAVTKEPYIVYTSNIFAILGLRSLYFCLSEIVERFKYVKYSLAFILIFIGAKIFIDHLIVNIPVIVSLIVTLVLLAGGIVASFYLHPQEKVKKEFF